MPICCPEIKTKWVESALLPLPSDLWKKKIRGEMNFEKNQGGWHICKDCGLQVKSVSSFEHFHVSSYFWKYRCYAWRFTFIPTPIFHCPYFYFPSPPKKNLFCFWKLNIIYYTITPKQISIVVLTGRKYDKVKLIIFELTSEKMLSTIYRASGKMLLYSLRYASSSSPLRNIKETLDIIGSSRLKFCHHKWIFKINILLMGLERWLCS